MTPERWGRVRQVFDHALALGAAERAAYVSAESDGDEELRHEVTSLLACATTTTHFADPAALPADAMLDRHFGPYRVVRSLGFGGMGAVYLAMRDDDQFRRRVAVKVVRPELMDEQMLRRFHNERQTLAVLDHPNIVRLLDGGTQDGVPYLVMDHVEGQPIDQYCESHKLSVPERLQLFRAVCGAVHYAHQNLVVHRDLKPGNILVTPEGVPKLLDFGIAKMLRPEYSSQLSGYTRTALQPLTPEYASPEQLLGQPVTTASDIYSLGVLLFLLLTGHHPFQDQSKSVADLVHAICETEPEKPSTLVLREASRVGASPRIRPRNLSRRLRGDLDRIVLMAVRKEPQRRYASAEHLSEDLRRHLEGKVVLARKSTWTYRLSKFALRHKPGVAATVVAAVLLVASAAMTIQQKRRAERRFTELRQFANFTINGLDDAFREGLTPGRKKLVEQALGYLDGLGREAGGDEKLMAELMAGYLKMGDILGNPFVPSLGETAAAQASYRKALLLAASLARAHPADPAATRSLALASVKLADVLAFSGDRVAAIAAYGQAGAAYRRLLEKDRATPEVMRDLMNVDVKIGSARDQLCDSVGALDAFRDALSIGEAWLDIDVKARPAVAFAKERVAFFAVMSGETAGVEPPIREALQYYQQAAGEKPSLRALRNIAKTYKTLAEVEKRTGKPVEALAGARQSLAITEKLLAGDPQNKQYQIDLHQALLLLVDLLRSSGQTREARAVTARALEFLDPLVHQPEPSFYHLQDYATLLIETPFPEYRNDRAALTSANRAVELTHGADPWALYLQSRAYENTGDRAQALAAARKALSLLPAARPGAPIPEVRRTLETHLAHLDSVSHP